MKALAIDANIEEVKEIEIEMQANSVYTFFSSILIDELSSIKEHVIYSDANALSEKKKAYFLGEQLLIGDALIVGRYDFEDRDVAISKEELNSLLTYEVSEFYQVVLELLASTDINLYRVFEVHKGSEQFQLNTEWVLYTFNIADIRTRDYFITELKNVIEVDESIEKYMQKMATLAMNAAG